MITGGKPLKGIIMAQGSKNSAVAVIIAALITGAISEISRVPDISDVHDCIDILKYLGCKTEFSNGRLLIDSSKAEPNAIPPNIMRKLRASSYLIGAELACFSECDVPESGGCDFGSRPINYHIKAMQSLGATVIKNECGIKLSAKQGLKGGKIVLDYPSVGATVNSILAACKAEGVTIIENAAREPHICDLCDYLSLCGADISGAGSSTVKIKSRPLHGAKFTLSSDMIESGTYLIYALQTGGSVTVEKTEPKELKALLDVLYNMGADISIRRDSVTVNGGALNNTSFSTAPYPGFPTDLQPQFASLMGISHGIGRITESVFSCRFGHISSLLPFGFKGDINGRELKIFGIPKYTSAVTDATDLRGGAALVGAALSAEGSSTINNAEYIFRGYEMLEKKLAFLQS